MARRGENEGIQVLADVGCEAIHDPAIPQASPNNQGQHEGVRVMEEIVLEGMEGAGEAKPGNAVRPEHKDQSR
jgi:hypothetical protein